MTNAQKYAYANSKNPEHAGVEATLKVLELLWNNQFSVIGGDALSWEVSTLGSSYLQCLIHLTRLSSARWIIFKQVCSRRLGYANRYGLLCDLSLKVS
jgi:hypothetical protein